MAARKNHRRRQKHACDQTANGDVMGNVHLTFAASPPPCVAEDELQPLTHHTNLASLAMFAAIRRALRGAGEAPDSSLVETAPNRHKWPAF
jgi:hypothetical protein